MFKEYNEKYPPYDLKAPSRARVEADKAAVLALIGKEDNMKNTEKIRPRKKWTAFAAAAAAAACLTVTAGAVSGWNLGAALSSWFGSPEKEAFADKLTGVEVSECSDNFASVDFSFLGAVSDDVLTTVFIEAKRTDGGIFDYSEKALDIPDELADKTDGGVLGAVISSKQPPSFVIGGDALCYKGGVRSGGYTNWENCTFDDGDPLDNRLTLALSFDTQSLLAQSDGSELDMLLNIRSVSRREDTVDNGTPIVIGSKETEKLAGSFKARIRLTLNTGASVRLTPDKDVRMMIFPHTNGPDELEYIPHTFRLTGLDISSTALSFTLDGEQTDAAYYLSSLDEYGKLVLKDGTEIPLNYRNRTYGASSESTKISGLDSWNMKLSFMYGRIIEVSDIASVEIGGEKITVNS